MAPAPVQDVEQQRRALVINRIGEIQEYLQAEAIRQAPWRQELGKMQDEALGWYQKLPADEPAAIETPHFICKVTPKEIEHVVYDKQKCFRLLGMKISEFLEACTITQKLINKKIPKDKHHLFQTEERTGDRSITVLRKPPAAA